MHNQILPTHPEAQFQSRPHRPDDRRHHNKGRPPSGMPRRVREGVVLKPEEVAKTVLFLASDDASNVQAAEIFVDGGSTGSPAGAPIYRG